MSALATAEAPAAAQPARTFNPWTTLIVVCVAQFMVVLDATIVNVALPSIQHGLGFSSSDLQWVVNAYTLFFGGFLLLGGRVADLLGRRRLFIIGLALFSGASLLNGFAQSSTMLIAGRALQGLGGALVSPAALSILTTTFPDSGERTKALGVWSGIAAGGGAFGLLLGGVLTDLISWQWVFFVNLPIGLAAIAAALRFVPESRVPVAERHFDIAGALSVTAGLVVLVYTIVKAQSYGWGSTRTLSGMAISVALLALFVWIEQRSRAPLFRLSILRIRTLLAANLSLLLVASGMFAMFFFASIYVQEILGYSPLKAGLAFLPATVGIAVGAGIAQQVVRRVGPRPVGVAGMLLAAAGMLLLTRTTANGSYLGELLPGLLPLSIGMGFTFVPITLMGTSGVEDDDAGMASGLYNTSQQVGGALGLAILSTLALDKTTSVLGHLGPAAATHAGRAVALVEGFHVAFAVGSGLLAGGAVLLLALLRRRHLSGVDVDAAIPAV